MASAVFWDKIADEYSKKPVENPDAFERKIAITKDEIKRVSGASASVLDIGCGTGSLALRLAETGAEVAGLDVSPEMIRIARDKVSAERSERVTFHVGAFDASFTAFQSESLDGICAYSLLHLVEDRAAALARIHDLLRPGGFFIASTVCLGETWFPYRPILWAMRKVGRAPMVKIVNRATLEREIESAGFVDIRYPDVGAKPTTVFTVARKP